MDDPTVEWDRNRYEECVSKIKPYLKSVGYVIKKDVKFVPIAGLTGKRHPVVVPCSVCVPGLERLKVVLTCVERSPTHVHNFSFSPSPPSFSPVH